MPPRGRLHPHSQPLPGLAADLLYFVPPGAACEVWRLTVKNLGSQSRRLRAFSYAEFGYFDALTDMTNLDWAAHIVHSRVEDGAVFTSTQFRPETAFFTSSRSPIGFDTDREVFIGRARDLSNPQVVESGQPHGSLAPRGNNIACLCHELTLAPGEEATLIYILGIGADLDAIQAEIFRYRQPAEVEAAFQA